MADAEIRKQPASVTPFRTSVRFEYAGNRLCKIVLTRVNRERTPIGQAYLACYNNQHIWTLDAIDIFDGFRRQGYGTRLMQHVRKFLRRQKAVALRSCNEGSGTVQLLATVFGEDKVRHYVGSAEVTHAEAIRIMDVEFGRTRSSVDLT